MGVYGEAARQKLPEKILKNLCLFISPTCILDIENNSFQISVTLGLDWEKSDGEAPW